MKAMDMPHDVWRSMWQCMNQAPAMESRKAKNPNEMRSLGGEIERTKQFEGPIDPNDMLA
jgi:hypothetical protein